MDVARVVASEVEIPTNGNDQSHAVYYMYARGIPYVYRDQGTNLSSLPATILGGETTPTDNERVSIPSPSPSSFGGDVNSSTPREGVGHPRKMK